jgi:hypothetical protein
MFDALELNEEDRMRLMRAVYSVFWRDDQINGVERSVLTALNQLFDLHVKDYDIPFRRAVDIAKEVNAIRNVRARIYFMRIIHDVYKKEITDIWFMGPETDHAKKFRIIYADLQNLVCVE